MKNNLIILLSILSFIAYGQDTSYYNQNWGTVSSIDKAHYYKILSKEQNSTRATEIIYYKSGQMKQEKNYSIYEKKTLDGKFKEWDEGGQLRKDIDYKEGKLNGTLLTYWANGKAKRVDTYENGKLLTGKCSDAEGNEIAYFNYEILPEYPGGVNVLLQLVYKEIKYPKKARRKGTEGQVVISFVIDKNGTMSNMKISKSVSDELDKEVIRVLTKIKEENTKWKPGTQDGEAISVLYNLPVLFRLK